VTTQLQLINIIIMNTGCTNGPQCYTVLNVACLVETYDLLWPAIVINSSRRLQT